MSVMTPMNILRADHSGQCPPSTKFGAVVESVDFCGREKPLREECNLHIEELQMTDQKMSSDNVIIHVSTILAVKQ
jgi:hypothetical protein